MIFNKKFDYPTSTRALIDGKRHYNITGQKLPSVTTILSATQSDEKKQSLANWRAKMGADLADKVRDVAAMRGTAMHRYHVSGGCLAITDIQGVGTFYTRLLAENAFFHFFLEDVFPF